MAESMVGRREWSDKAVRSLAAFALVAIPLMVFYVLVPNPGSPPSGHHIDPLTNAVTAWHMGMRGTVILDGFEDATMPEYYRNIGWYVDSPRGPVSQYPPGAAAVAAPFYRIAGDPTTLRPMTGTNNPDAPPLDLPMPSVGPANLAAAMTVALAMGFVSATIVASGLSLAVAVGSGLIGGVATPMWTVAASSLWQHGPAAMWIALGLFLLSKARHLLAGLAFGGAILTRPHLALIAAAVGCYMAWKERRARPMVEIGAGSALGLAVLLAFNWWLWGRFTISGGYGQSFTDNVVGGPSVSGSREWLGFLENIAGGLFDPRIGVLMVSVFLFPLLIKVVAAWRDAPQWARGAALGGLLYLLVQYKANRYSGGAGFLGYRYPLEPLIAATPLLAFAFGHWERGSRVARWLFWGTVAMSAVLLLVP